MGTNGHGSGQGHSHSVKDILAAGETPQRLSPSTASLSVTSVPSMSPNSPRFPYTSRFSPKNLTVGSSTSSSTSSTNSPKLPPQPESHPQTQPPTRLPPPPSQATQRKPVPQQRKHTPSETSTHPDLYPHYQSQPHSKEPTSQTKYQAQQRQAHSQLQQPNSRSQDSHSSTSTSTSTSSDPKQPHIAELHQRFPPITRAVTASSHQQVKQHQQVDRRLKSSHGRRHGDDKPASDSNDAQFQSQSHKPSFFSFSKAAKSFDRPLQLAPAQSQAQAHPQPTRVAMSATDQLSITKQSSKQSGKNMTPNIETHITVEAKEHLPPTHGTHLNCHGGVCFTLPQFSPSPSPSPPLQLTCSKRPL